MLGEKYAMQARSQTWTDLGDTGRLHLHQERCRWQHPGGGVADKQRGENQYHNLLERECAENK